MFESIDWSNVTVGLAAVALAFWAMKYFIPSERTTYRELLLEDRTAAAKEREASYEHIQAILQDTQAEQQRMREERTEDRKSLERIIKQVLVALAESGMKPEVES